MYVILTIILLFTNFNVLAANKTYSELKECNIGRLADEISSYKAVVGTIIDYVVTGQYKGKTYEE
jgi:hypothetical protein